MLLEEYLAARIMELEMENKELKKQLAKNIITFAFEGVNMNNSYIVTFENGDIKVVKEEEKTESQA